VRDTLLGLDVKDIDMATTLLPEQTQAALEAAGIKQVPTGIAHGTITAVLPGGPVEITTLRRDVTTDGRHATVAFSQEWREDAARRDFTINALYADPRTLAVSDYFGGLADLATRTVRFIGDPEQRIREDYLRILRYFRFQARFGSLPADAASQAACAALAPGMKGLSRERIASELMNLLALPDPSPTLATMAGLGVLGDVLPEADPADLPALVATEAREEWRPMRCGAWPACFPPIRRWPNRSPRGCACRWPSASDWPAPPRAGRRCRAVGARAGLCPRARGGARPAAAGGALHGGPGGVGHSAPAAQGRADRGARGRRRAGRGAHLARGRGALGCRRLPRRGAGDGTARHGSGAGLKGFGARRALTA
jgi:hypothetical protein